MLFLLRHGKPLLALSAALLALVGIGAGSVYATSANISPGYKVVCVPSQVRFTLSWSGTPDFYVWWDDDNGGWFDNQGFGSATSTVEYGDYDDPGMYYPYLQVDDLYNTAISTGTIVGRGPGVPPCPLSPSE